MASIRKVGKKWLAEVRRKGSPPRSKTFFSKPEAMSWALEIERQMGKGGTLPLKTLGDALTKYAKEVSPSKKGARWEIIRLEKLGRDDIAGMLLTDITHDSLNDWKNARSKTGVKSSTVLREMNLLSSVLSAARLQWKWMTEAPMRDVKRPKAPAARDVRISEGMIVRILLALGYQEDAPVITDRQQIAVAFLLALETAMRQGELWGLHWEHIDFAGRFAMLADTKNGTKRNVPLSKRAIELINKLRPKKTGKLFTVRQATAGTIFRRAVKLAGIDGVTFHDTRHEALTRLARKLDVLDLARMVGHLDPRSLMIYYNPTASEIASRLD